MGEIIDLEKYRPHVCGKARCLGCKYEWVAVAPTETIWLECPKCSAMKGQFFYAQN